MRWLWAGEEGFPGNMKVVVTYTVATHGEHAFGDASLVRREAHALLSGVIRTHVCCASR